MKKLLIALAALMTLAFTGCDKENPLPDGDALAGTTWTSLYNGSPVTVAFEKGGIVTISADSELFTRAYVYTGTYTYDAPNITIQMQIDGKTETFTGTYSNGVLRISGSMGTIEFIQTAGPSPDDGDDENNSNIGSDDLSHYLLGKWECYKLSWRSDDGTLHEEESPFAIMEADAEGDVIFDPGYGTRSEEELVGYETNFFTFRTDGILYAEAHIEYLNGQSIMENDYFNYTMAGGLLTISSSDFTGDFTVSCSTDENGDDIMVLRGTSATTAEEMPGTEQTIYLHRLSGYSDEEYEPSERLKYFEFSGKWEVYASSDKNEKFGPKEDTEVIIELLGYDNGEGSWYSRYLASDAEESAGSRTRSDYYSVELEGKLYYELLDGYSFEKKFYPMAVILFNGNKEEKETWYIQIDPEDENLATWWNGDNSSKAYCRYLRCLEQYR